MRRSDEVPERSERRPPPLRTPTPSNNSTPHLSYEKRLHFPFSVCRFSLLMPMPPILKCKTSESAKKADSTLLLPAPRFPLPEQSHQFRQIFANQIRLILRPRKVLKLAFSAQNQTGLNAGG